MAVPEGRLMLRGGSCHRSRLCPLGSHCRCMAQEPLVGSKAGPRRTMRLRARQTPVDGAAACFARLLQRGAPAVAVDWAEEPLGGLKNWPTSHVTTPRSSNTCWRLGSVPCRPTAAKGALSVPGLVYMAVPTGRLVPSGRIMPHIMPMPGFVCMAVPTGRLIHSAYRSCPCPAFSFRGGS
jgi:hypothetical protein